MILTKMAVLPERGTMHDMELAWSLSEAAGHCLDGSKRSDVYVALGAGDTSTVIRDLTHVAAREQVELAAEVVAALRAWWLAHEDTDNRYTPAAVAGLRTRPEPPPPPPPSEAPPAPRYIKPLSIDRNYLHPKRIR
jgi:hypothetical protein